MAEVKKDRVDFEAKIDELQKIVEKLESDVSLEESMRLFESGLGITKECIDELNKTQENLAELEDQLDTVLSSVSGADDGR